MGDVKEFHQKVGTEVDNNNTATQPQTHDETVLESSQPETKTDGSISRWGIAGNKFFGVSDSCDKVPSGFYEPCVSHDGSPFLLRKELHLDDIMILPDNESKKVLDEIAEFNQIESRFRNNGYIYKRGILLWGPPGSGKTTTIQLLIKSFVEELSGIALQVSHPVCAKKCLRLIRDVEPKRRVLGIMEDIDALVHTYGEDNYLSLLDGEEQVDDIVFVATTNYPERLDKRFVDRPSRFDTISKIDMPTAEARKFYLSKKFGEDYTDLDILVDKTDGYSVAHLKELVILLKCFGKSIDESIDRLDGMIDRSLSSDQTNGKKHKFGFNQG